MSEEFEESEEVVEELEDFEPKHFEMMDLFDTLSFREKWRKVMEGLKEPKDSGDYKYAKLQMIRLMSPISAIVVPIIFMVLLAIFAALKPPPRPPVAVTIIEPEEVQELDDIDEIIEDPPEPPDPVDTEIPTDINMDVQTPSPPTEFSPQPAQFDAVAMVKSPVIMKNIYGSRSPGQRGSSLAAYGGSGATEGAVLRALRWLKKCQGEDGSWDAKSGDSEGKGGKSGAAAYTGEALLTFLAHGETPASEEFGPTVEKAIKFLVGNQKPDGLFKSVDRHNYSHPIATYALSEAYGLTKIPMVKEAAEKAIVHIVKGQHPCGGWDYNMKQSERNDTSYMGWCAQAVKAGVMAGLEVPGLHEAKKKAIQGFLVNHKAGGGFGYTGPSPNHGLTGVGVLCIQLCGGAELPAVRDGIQVLLNTSKVDWTNPKGMIYYWYYNTQAFFHTGGKLWNDWNAQFAPQLVKNQQITKAAIADPHGKMQDIGCWDNPPGVKGKSARVMATSLCALQLQVYYRYLPTFKTPAHEAVEETKIASDDDVKIDIDI